MTHIDENKVRACPLCHSKDELKIYGYSKEGSEFVYVHCYRCMEAGPEGETVEVAIKNWNNWDGHNAKNPCPICHSRKHLILEEDKNSINTTLGHVRCERWECGMIGPSATKIAEIVESWNVITPAINCSKCGSDATRTKKMRDDCIALCCEHCHFQGPFASNHLQAIRLWNELQE